MQELADHAERNRAYWTKSSPGWVESGRRSWATDRITWGIWEVPESDVGALGDLGKLRGLDAIELGCGTGYVSAWLAKLGARPVGVDVTPVQLERARAFQREFDLDFPLIEASAEDVPLPDAGFDLAISEYGASIWCDPEKWIPEAARLLRPGGVLVFLRNSTISMVCSSELGIAMDRLQRDWFGMNRLEWPDDHSVEFHPPTGEMLRLLRRNGFEIEDLIELKPPDQALPSRHEHVSLEWSKRWPSEEIWRAHKHPRD